MSGETVASWAVSEPGRGWAPLNPSVTATPTDSGYRIDGTKDRVEAGAQSAVLLVVARCGDELRQFLVPTDAPGVTIEPQQSVDLVKQYARVRFDGVVVERSAAVGTPAETAALVDRQSQIAQTLQCAEVVGILQTVFDLTVAVGAGPAHLRPPAGVLPGPQTQVRRHEAVAGGLPRHHGRARSPTSPPTHPGRACRPASPSPTWARWPARSSRPACRCTAASASPGNTTCTCTCAGVTLYRSMFGTPEEHNLRVYECEKAGPARSTR